MVKAAMDALAVCYAKELVPFGIETAIVVPGALTTGANPFEHAGAPADDGRAAQYRAAYRAGFEGQVKADLAATVPADADPSAVARAVTDLVALRPGRRPLRVSVDPADDGAAVSFAVIDRVREQFLQRIGHADLLHPEIRPV